MPLDGELAKCRETPPAEPYDAGKDGIGLAAAVFLDAVSVIILPGLVVAVVGRRVPGTRDGRFEVLRLMLIGYCAGILIVPVKTGSLIYDVFLMVLNFVVVVGLL